MKPTIVIADDHPLLLNGNKYFLNGIGYNVVATASDGNLAYNKIIKHIPNIAILDFDMPKQDGLEVAQLCKKNELPTKIIILTLYKEEAIIHELGNSIRGYILKEDATNEIETCIKKVLAGELYISNNINSTIHLSNPSETLENLTPSEIKVLRYLAKNSSSSDIAEMLFISKRTVEKHRSNIIKKLKIEPTQNGLLLWVQKHPELFNT